MARKQLPEDFKDFIKYLNANKAGYLLLGGWMVATLLICTCGERRKNPQPAVETGIPFHLEIRAMVAAGDLKYDSIYRTSASRAFTVTDFRYYVSTISAIREDGTEQKLSCPVILVDPHKRSYAVGRLPAGLYKGLRFTVGLDSAVNHGDPTVFAKDHPLAIQTPGMHWDWNSGYLFMKIEGRVDTTQNGAGAPATEFFYHIGLDKMKRAIDMQTPFSVGDAQENGIKLKFDLAGMLDGIDMKTEIVTHSFDNQPLARRIADNWQKAFSTDN